jgi:hypothetical protein
VLGGYIPQQGVLVQLQYRVIGVPVGWAPFETPVHTNADGRWRITFPMSAGAKGYTYLLRGLITSQAGWPYLGTITNTIARHVHG